MSRHGIGVEACCRVQRVVPFQGTKAFLRTLRIRCTEEVLLSYGYLCDLRTCIAGTRHLTGNIAHRWEPQNEGGERGYGKSHRVANTGFSNQFRKKRTHLSFLLFKQGRQAISILVQQRVKLAGLPITLAEPTWL